MVKVPETRLEVVMVISFGSQSTVVLVHKLGMRPMDGCVFQLAVESPVK